MEEGRPSSYDIEAGQNRVEEDFEVQEGVYSAESELACS